MTLRKDQSSGRNIPQREFAHLPLGIPVHDGSPDERSPSYDECVRRTLPAPCRRARGQVAELERLIGRNSGNSSKRASADPRPNANAGTGPRDAGRPKRSPESPAPSTDGPTEASAQGRSAQGGQGVPADTNGRDAGGVVVSSRRHSLSQWRGRIQRLRPQPRRLVKEVRRSSDRLPRPRGAGDLQYRSTQGPLRCGGLRSTGRSRPRHPPRPASDETSRRGVAYFMARQHLPYERHGRGIAGLYGIEVSTGFLDRCYAEGCVENLDGFVDTVKELLRAEPVVHVDETSDRVGNQVGVVPRGGERALHPVARRRPPGFNGVVRTGVLPAMRDAVHDRLAQYDSYTDAEHAYCGAHLQRASPAWRPSWASTCGHGRCRSCSPRCTTPPPPPGEGQVGHRPQAARRFLEAYDDDRAMALS